MAFPSTLDSFTTKVTGDVIQASHVNDLQTSIGAAQTKVGVDASAVTTTLDYYVKNGAAGGLLYLSATNTPGKLAIGATGQLLTVTAGVPAWTNTMTSTNSSGPALTIDQIGSNSTLLLLKWAGSTRFTFANSGALTAIGGLTGTSLSSTSISIGLWAAGDFYSSTTGALRSEGNLHIYHNNGGGAPSKPVVLGASTTAETTGIIEMALGTKFKDAMDISFATTTGTKIGTATTQKLAFYNSTPIVQGAAVTDASGGATIDAEARTALNALLARIRSLGLIAT